jgi:malate synthase
MFCVQREAVQIAGCFTHPQELLLSKGAVRFLLELDSAFERRRQSLLKERRERQAAFDRGELPDFLPSTAWIREGEWQCAPAPADLCDRRVEITGPVDRKTIIHGLNSGAKVFVADFEDANSPTWSNVLEGHVNLRDSVCGAMQYAGGDGKRDELDEVTASLMIRPRGLHLDEKHFFIEGRPIAASLFDFGLYFFHNARRLIENGSGPYFYLPKLESYLEARLWNDVFDLAQDALRISRGTIRATVLIETLPAAFEMEEILYELRNHSAGLNCGRWDYIFSFIKKFRSRPDFVLPELGEVTMDRPFLSSCARLLIETCHRRGVSAIGGMAAQIPCKHDPTANEEALSKVRKDKLREVWAGYDGTWVAHPGLVPLARSVFDTYMRGQNQIHRRRESGVKAADLLAVPEGNITEAGLRRNIDVGIRYLSAWLLGNGCVPIGNLMEDAATAEICRTQVWQWVRHGARLSDGQIVTPDMVANILQNYPDSPALRLFRDLVMTREPDEFWTSLAYEYLTSPAGPSFSSDFLIASA